MAYYDEKIKMEQLYMMFLVFSNDQIRISKEGFVQIFCKLQINSFDLTDTQGNEIGVALYKKYFTLF